LYRISYLNSDFLKYIVMPMFYSAVSILYSVAVLGFTFFWGGAVGGHNCSWGHGPMLPQWTTPNKW